MSALQFQDESGFNETVPPDPGIFETFIRNLKPEDCSAKRCDFLSCIHVHLSPDAI